jgi:inner membrane transporter RhtA
VGALAGLVLLAEVLDPRQWVAIACITAASAGAVATTPRSIRDRLERRGEDAQPDLAPINRT